MNINKRLWYYGTIIAFPLFFLLHGVNENTGLIESAVILKLLVYYLLVSIGVGVLSELLIKDLKRSFVFCFYFFLYSSSLVC